MTSTVETPRVLALSLWRPWSSAILRHGKTVENRSWGTGFRGLILLHATASWDPDAADYVRRTMPSTSPAERAAMYAVVGDLADSRRHPTGVIGVARIESICVSGRTSKRRGACDCGPWATPGQMHWRLADVRALPFALPAKGAQRLWAPEPALLEQIRDLGVALDA